MKSNKKSEIAESLDIEKKRQKIFNNKKVRTKQQRDKERPNFIELKDDIIRKETSEQKKSRN